VYPWAKGASMVLSNNIVCHNQPIDHTSALAFIYVFHPVERDIPLGMEGAFV
jgi:hypothetical protein